MSCLFFSSRTSIVKQLTEDGLHHLPAHVPEKFQNMDISGKAKLTKQTTIGDLEVTSLNPKTEGRIRLLNPKVSPDLIFYLYIHLIPYISISTLDLLSCSTMERFFLSKVLIFITYIGIYVYISFFF